MDTKIHVRKLQTSKTGYYINIPKKLSEDLKLTGTEHIKFVHDTQSGEVTIHIIKV